MLMTTRAESSSDVTVEMLDDKLLGEFVIVHRRDELLKLFERLLAQVAAIDEKEHAAGPGVFDQTIGKIDRRERLAGAGGHLNQGARLVGGEGLFEIVDRFDLRLPESVGDERR